EPIRDRRRDARGRAYRDAARLARDARVPGVGGWTEPQPAPLRLGGDVFYFLCLVVDAYSRKVVGWTLH
ncbi:MAG: hypothetical protein ACK6DV_02880, partial [Deltaproteobacteria bacterium]